VRFRLLITEGWRSLGANISTTIAATMTVLVGMFLLGLFIALGSWTLSWSNHVKSELLVKVYFETDRPRTDDRPRTYQATRAEENAVANTLNANPYVKSFTFVPKLKALKEMQRREPEMTAGLAWNPLPDTFEITPTRPEDIKALKASLLPLPPGVEKIEDGGDRSRRILQVAHVIEIVFTIATVILLVAATMLIANTIRLSIFSRRREIEVMKLVGATNWFVRGPFMIEGLLCGLGGALLAVFLLLVGKEVALPTILQHGLSNDPDVHALAFPMTALILVAMGLALGAIGSGLTLRRFLRV
jgi:cell division transport system permease protein